MKLYLSGLIKMGQLLRIDDHDPSFVHTYEACLRKVFAETGSGLSGRAQHIGQEGDGQPDIDLDPIGSHFPKIPGQLPQLGCQFPLHVDALEFPPHPRALGAPWEGCKFQRLKTWFPSPHCFAGSLQSPFRNLCVISEIMG